MGETSEVFDGGRAHRYAQAAEGLTAAGLLGATIWGRRHRLGASLAGAALLAGSACARFAIFHAGVQSAEDPRFTVGPQRRRADDRC